MQVSLSTLSKNEIVKHKFSVVTALSDDICELSKLMILFFPSYSDFEKGYPHDTAGSALTDHSRNKRLKASSVFRFFSSSKILSADVSKDFCVQTKDLRSAASMATEVLKSIHFF